MTRRCYSDAVGYDAPAGVDHMLAGSSTRRKKTFRDESLAQLDAEGVVDVQHGDGHAADGGAAAQKRPVPAEVTRPLVAARVEERGELARVRVQPADVRAFE